MAAPNSRKSDITSKNVVTCQSDASKLPIMETFLTESKSALNDLAKYHRIKVVLGNRTCDLDSAVCALLQGYFYYHNLSENDKKIVAVIPLMNITEREFRIKTEVVWFLQENGIQSTLITFRNQIDLHALGRDKVLELTLVDHHNLMSEDLELADLVVEIIDHRPQDPNWLWPKVNFTLDPVGSCATLVAKNILTKNPAILNAQTRNLLRGPILVDTQNFSIEAARAKPLDYEVIRDLEKCDISSSTRDETYNKILDAKTDISGLTAEDLLIKDLKIIDDVAIPGFPILVQEFMELPNALEDVASFATGGSFTLVILLGMDLKGEKMRRDIGVFVSSTTHEHEVKIRIVSGLMSANLELMPLTEKHCDEKGIDGKGYKFLLFRQGNVRATRKQILPIIQSALAELRHRC